MFNGCVFGEAESNCWYFDEEAEFINCEWSEITEYPDYGDYDFYEEVAQTFDPDAMEQITIESDVLTSLPWIGYMAVNPESGESERMTMGSADDAERFMTLILDEDGTGRIEDNLDTIRFDWNFIDDETVCLETGEGNIYLTLYKGYYPESDYFEYWVLMDYFGELIWMC